MDFLNLISQVEVDRETELVNIRASFLAFAYYESIGEPLKRNPSISVFYAQEVEK